MKITNEALQVKTIVKSYDLPTEIDGINEVHEIVNEAKEPRDLIKASAFLSKVALKYAQQETSIKNNNKDILRLSNNIKEQITLLENSIKDKALKMVVVDKKPTGKWDKYGEVIFKEENNLTKGVFSYTPKKIDITIDREKILNDDKYKHLLKEVTTYVIDEEKLELAIMNKEVPLIRKERKERISIMKKNLNTEWDKIVEREFND